MSNIQLRAQKEPTRPMKGDLGRHEIQGLGYDAEVPGDGRRRLKLGQDESEES